MPCYCLLCKRLVVLHFGTLNSKSCMLHCCVATFVKMTSLSDYSYMISTIEIHFFLNPKSFYIHTTKLVFVTVDLKVWIESKTHMCNLSAQSTILCLIFGPTSLESSVLAFM